MAVTDAVAEKFKLSNPMPEEVEQADLIALATERRDLMPPCSTDEWARLNHIKPMEEIIRAWAPDEAKDRFMDRFIHLVLSSGGQHQSV